MPHISEQDREPVADARTAMVTDAMIEAGIEAAECCNPSKEEVVQIYLAMHQAANTEK